MTKPPLLGTAKYTMSLFQINRHDSDGSAKEARRSQLQDFRVTSFDSFKGSNEPERILLVIHFLDIVIFFHLKIKQKN